MTSVESGNSFQAIGDFLGLGEAEIGELNQLKTSSTLIQALTNKAEEFVKLKNELLLHEVNEEHKYVNLNQTIANLTSNVQLLESSTEEQRQRNQELTNERDTFKEQLDVERETTSKLTDEVKLSQNVINQKVQSLQVLELREKELCQQKSSLEKELQASHLHEEELQTLLQEVREQNQQSVFERGQLSVQNETLIEEKNLLQKQLDERQEQLEHLKNTYQNQLTTLTNERRQMENELTKLREKVSANKDGVSNEQQFSEDSAMAVDSDQVASLREEIAMQKELATLWENKANDLETQLNSLLNENKQLTEAVLNIKAEKEELNQKRLREVHAIELSCKEVQAKLDEANATLKAPNNDASERLNISPVLKQLEEDNNISLTKVFSENVQLKERVETLQRRLKRVSDRFSGFQQQLRLRLPTLKQNNEVLLQNQLYMNKLSEQLRKSKETESRCKAEIKQLQGQLSESSIILQSANEQCTLFARQVKCLLLLNGQTEKVWETVFSDDNVPKLEAFMSKGSDSSLQSLLVQFPELQSADALSSKVVQLQKEVSDSETRLSIKLAEERTKLEQAVEVASINWEKDKRQMESDLNWLKLHNESLIKEREMYKEMFSEAIQKISVSCDSSNLDENENLKESIKNLKDNLEIYQKEMESNNASLTEQNKNLVQDKMNLVRDLTKLKLRNRTTIERFNLLNKRFADLHSTLEQLQKVNVSQQNVIAGQDKQHYLLEEQIVNVNSLAKRMTQEVESLKAEKSIWLKAKERLSSDTTRLLEDRERLTKLVSNLQSLLSEQQRSSNEYKRLDNAQIKNLQSITEATKTELVTVNKEYVEYKAESQASIATLRKDLETTSEELEKMRQEKTSLTSEVNELKALNTKFNQLIDIEKGRYAAIQSRLQKHKATNSTEREKHLEAEIEQLKSSVAELERKHTLAEKSCIEYRKISEAAERALKKTTDELKALETNSAEEKETLRKEKAALQERCTLLQEELSNNINDYLGKSKEFETKLSIYIKENTDLSGELDTLKATRQELAVKCTELEKEITRQTEQAESAREAYEKELLRHASVTSSLQIMRTDYNRLNNKLVELNNENNALRTKLADATSESESTLGTKETQTLNSSVSNTEETVTRFDISALESLSIEELHAQLKRAAREVNILLVQKKLLLNKNTQLTNELHHLQTRQHKILESNSEGLSSSTSVNQVREYTLLQESNSALREQDRKKTETISDLRNQIMDLTQQLHQMKQSEQQCRTDLDEKCKAIEQLNTEITALQNRNLEILKKVNSLPSSQSEQLSQSIAEKEIALKELQNKITSLNEDLQNSINEVSNLKKQNEEAQSSIEQLTARNTNLASAWKSKYDQIVAKSLEKVGQIRQQLSLKNSELESRVSECQALHKELERLKSASGESVPEESVSANKEKLQELENTCSLLSEQLEASNKELESKKEELEKANVKLAELTASKSNDSSSSNEDELEKIRQQIGELRDQLSKETETKEFLEGQCSQLQGQLEALKTSAEQLSANDSVTEISNVETKLDEMIVNTICDILQKELGTTVPAEIRGDKDTFANFLETEFSKYKTKLAEETQTSLKEAHEQQVTSMKKEFEMRNKLKVNMLEKKLQRLTQQLEQAKSTSSPTGENKAQTVVAQSSSASEHSSESKPKQKKRGLPKDSKANEQKAKKSKD